MTAVEAADLETGLRFNKFQEIQADPTLRFAYGIWQSSEAKLKDRIANRESQASQLKCHNVGIPLALSLFATVVTLAGVWQKKGIITDLKWTLSAEDLARKAYNIRVQNLEQQGKHFMFNDLPEVTNGGTAGPAGTCSSKWVTYNNGVVVCVLLLGGICSLFIYRVLCDA